MVEDWRDARRLCDSRIQVPEWSVRLTYSV
jgi:hypothetical protein